VQIQSPRFDAAPAIAPHYLSTEADRQVAADSLRLTRAIVAQPALARTSRRVKPGVQFQSDAELARLAGDIATTIFHPVGTTKMGAATTRWQWSTPPAGAWPARRPDCGPARGRRRRDAAHHSGNTNSPT